MNSAMFSRAWASMRRTVMWYSIGTALYVTLVLSSWRAMKATVKQLQAALNSGTQAVTRAFGASDMSTIEGFASGRVMGLLWPLLASCLVIAVGSSLVAREVEQGTVELWLSVPIRRGKLLLSKVAAMLLGWAVFVVVSVFAVAAGVAAGGESLGAGPLTALGVRMFVFGFAVAGYAVLLSARSSQRGRAAAIAAAITTGFYLLTVLGRVDTAHGWIADLSVFSTTEVTRTLRSGYIPWGSTLAWLGVGSACFGAAVWSFEKRDAVG